MKDKTREIISSKKAAQKLNTTEEKILELINSQKLKGFLVDGEYRTTMTEIENFRNGPFASELKAKD